MDNEKRDKATLVLSSGGLDHALACFNIATTAAAMGMEVTIFFTFWGLNVISRPGFRRTGGPVKRLLSLLNRGGTRSLRLSRLNMGGVGTFMMKRLMRREKMPSLEELVELAASLGVKFVACSTTCGLMGVGREQLLPSVSSMAGAATFLEEARNSRVSLFI